jgi:hypothetical protein
MKYSVVLLCIVLGLIALVDASVIARRSNLLAKVLSSVVLTNNSVILMEETDNVSLNLKPFPQRIRLQQLVQQQLLPNHPLLLHPHPLIYLHHQFLQRYLLTLVKLTVDERVAVDAVGMQIQRLSLRLPLLPMPHPPLLLMPRPLLNPELLPTMEALTVVRQLV